MSEDQEMGGGPVPGRQPPGRDPNNPDSCIRFGRLYFNQRSLIPYDEEERDRLDIFHKFCLEASEGLLYSAAIEPYQNETRILDVGTGTGIWSIAMARENPHMHVLGIDQAQIQPDIKPANCHYNYFDIEAPWNIVEPESWQSRRTTYDMAHIRMMLGSVSNWPELYRKVFQSLRPGGAVEHVELDWELRARDNTMPEDAALQRWNSYLQEAMTRAGQTISIGGIEHRLREAGFVDIRHHSVDAGCNPWSPDPAESNVARWFNLGLVCSVEGMTLIPFTQYLGMTEDQAVDIIKAFQREVCTMRIRSYGTIHVWTAKRPEGS